MSKYWNCCFSS